jgi:AraC-like DNA-binding protein
MRASRGASAPTDVAKTTLVVERDPSVLGRATFSPRPVLVAPLEAQPVTIELLDAPSVPPVGLRHADRGDDLRGLDRARFALIPARSGFRITSDDKFARCVTIGLGEGAIHSLFVEYEGDVERSVLALVLGRTTVFARTRWVDELLHRYVFERAVCEKHASLAARFLETELVKEVYFLGKELLAQHTRPSVVHEGSALVAKARAHVDARPFETPRVSELAKIAGTSESTLLRAFRKELGVTPAEYARDVRLAEAKLMLESGRYSASEVASRVGYGTLSAFTVAFTRAFGKSPSSVKNARASASLPPHGEPPRPSRPTRPPPRRSRETE